MASQPQAFGDTSLPEERVLRVSNIYYGATNNDVTRFLERFHVLDWYWDFNKITEQPIVFALFATLAHAMEAQRALDGRHFLRRSVRVQRATRDFRVSGERLLRPNEAGSPSQPPGPQQGAPGVPPQFNPRNFPEAQHTNEPQASRGPPVAATNILILNNLDGHASDEVVRYFLRGYNVIDVKIVTAHNSSNTAFVLMASHAERQQAIVELNGRRVFGRPITVEPCYKTWPQGLHMPTHWFYNHTQPHSQYPTGPGDMLYNDNTLAQEGSAPQYNQGTQFIPVSNPAQYNHGTQFIPMSNQGYQNIPSTQMHLNQNQHGINTPHRGHRGGRRGQRARNRQAHKNSLSGPSAQQGLEGVSGPSNPQQVQVSQAGLGDQASSGYEPSSDLPATTTSQALVSSSLPTSENCGDPQVSPTSQSLPAVYNLMSCLDMDVTSPEYRALEGLPSVSSTDRLSLRNSIPESVEEQAQNDAEPDQEKQFPTPKEWYDFQSEIIRKYQIPQPGGNLDCLMKDSGEE